MSCYYAITKHPETGKWENAEWLDDHFGIHHYGVRFPDGRVFDPERIKCDQKDLRTDYMKLESEAVNRFDVCGELRKQSILREYMESAYNLGKLEKEDEQAPKEDPKTLTYTNGAYCDKCKSFNYKQLVSKRKSRSNPETFLRCGDCCVASRSMHKRKSCTN